MASCSERRPPRALAPSIGAVLALASFTCVLGCSTEREVEGPSETAVATPASARRIVASRERRDPLRAVAAAYTDEDYANDELVSAVRLVYRVELRSPPGFGRLPPAAPRTSAELLIDATPDRLRATFAGPGWPLSSGSQVRLRADRDGTYVYDDDGGRPLPRGLLAEWFQHGTVGDAHKPYLGIQPPISREATRVGALVCALLSEWAGRSREHYAWRCERGSPARFLFGPWVAERTAELPMELPRSSLRADDLSPPDDVEGAHAGALIPTHLLERLPPAHEREVGTEPTLHLKNELEYRIVFMIGAVPVGWVDPGSSIDLEGLRPGTYYVGGMRPLGTTGWPPRYLPLPATVVMR
jgi:hypothetical protein